MAKKETTKNAPKKEAAKKPVAGKESAKKDAVKSEQAKELAAPAKKSAVAVLSTTDIGDHLAATFSIPKSHAKIYLNETIALIGKHLKKGARIRMSGLGVFQVKKRAARKGRNPNTGASIKIKASKRVVFAASSDLKAKL